MLGLRPPLAGLTTLAPAAGLVGVIAAMIGTVSFDGMSETTLWVNVGGELGDFFGSLGLSSETAFEFSNAVGLVALVALVFGLYRLGIAGHEDPRRAQLGFGAGAAPSRPRWCRSRWPTWGRTT